MSDQPAPALTSTDLAHERTDLALDRTVLAHERTLLAWVRTAASLISFGFTIYKFFDLSGKSAPADAHWALGPRGFAIGMIGIGLASLILATVDHARSRRSLKAQGYKVPRSLALITALLVAGLGVLGFMLAVLHR